MIALINKLKSKFLRKKGQKLLNKGKIQQAHAVFRKLLSLDNSADTLFNLGVTLLSLNHYEESETFFEKVAKEYPDNYLNLLSLAEAKLFQKKWNEAIDIYKKLTTIYPDKKSFSQQLEMAEDVVLREKYIRSKALINEARDFLNEKNGDKAIEKLEKALTYNPNNPHLLNNIGSIYLLKKKYEKAYEYFEKALLLEPENQKIKKNLNVVKQKIKS
jgi:protein O-mannosyl-transferase